MVFLSFSTTTPWDSKISTRTVYILLSPLYESTSECMRVLSRAVWKCFNVLEGEPEYEGVMKLYHSIAYLMDRMLLCLQRRTRCGKGKAKLQQWKVFPSQRPTWWDACINLIYAFCNIFNFHISIIIFFMENLKLFFLFCNLIRRKMLSW